MTYRRPWRRISLQFSQMRFTLARTFIASLPRRSPWVQNRETINIARHTDDARGKSCQAMGRLVLRWGVHSLLVLFMTSNGTVASGIPGCPAITSAEAVPARARWEVYRNRDGDEAAPEDSGQGLGHRPRAICLGSFPLTPGEPYCTSVNPNGIVAVNPLLDWPYTLHPETPCLATHSSDCHLTEKRGTAERRPPPTPPHKNAAIRLQAKPGHHVLLKQLLTSPDSRIP
jgi:hypothetical protein